MQAHRGSGFSIGALQPAAPPSVLLWHCLLLHLWPRVLRVVRVGSWERAHSCESVNGSLGRRVIVQKKERRSCVPMAGADVNGKMLAGTPQIMPPPLQGATLRQTHQHWRLWRGTISAPAMSHDMPATPCQAAWLAGPLFINQTLLACPRVGHPLACHAILRNTLDKAARTQSKAPAYGTCRQR